VWWGPQVESEAVRAIHAALDRASTGSTRLRSTAGGAPRRSSARSAAQGALAFVLSHPAVTGAIVGVRNEREAAELALAARLRLTPDEVAGIASRASE
jgi:aryl-alcohol dehydrogenase-like predicted oxidoreductase